MLALLGAIASFIIGAIVLAYGIGLALLLVTSWQTYAVLFCIGLAYRIYLTLTRAHHAHR